MTSHSTLIPRVKRFTLKIHQYIIVTNNSSEHVESRNEIEKLISHILE